MEQNSKYYELLHSVTDDHKVNHTGMVVGGVLPFHTDGEAVKFVMEKFPSATAETNPVEWNPQKAKEIAANTLYELEYLKQKLYDLHDKCSKEHDAYLVKAAEADRDGKSWELEINQIYAAEALGRKSGINDAIGVLIDRTLSLLMIAPPVPKEWWAERKSDHEHSGEE